MSANLNVLSAATTRRSALGLAGSAALVAALAACAPAGSDSKAIKYWDMPWGLPSYDKASRALTAAYKPRSGLLPAQFQIIQWANFTQTFSSAIASKTGPAVSSGGGFQAFQFAKQGAIAYADDLIDSFKKDGTYDDFLPGVIDGMKTANGYAAVPTQLDMRAWWYRKSILDENGLALPTTWDEYLTVGKALAKKGIYSFGVGVGPNNSVGAQAMLSMMINNGGGLYAESGEFDVLNERNVEAMDWVREFAREGMIDPGSVAYTTDNVNAQWKAGKIAMGISTPGINHDLGDTKGDILVAEPMTGPHGDKGTLQLLNNMMMYKNTPSQASSEAFLGYWVKHMSTFWKQEVIPALPVMKSIAALPEFQKDTQMAKLISTWQPIAKGMSAQSPNVDSRLAAIDGGEAITQFTQTMLAGKTDSKTALQKLSSDLQAL